ncbi:MAG TPA: phosphoglucosamine mutase [Bacillota bacterium]
MALFGTDGIRGVVNRELTPALAAAAGLALAAYLRPATGASAPAILVGRDTRRSGGMLQGALEAGVCAAGGIAVDVGVLPTPALAWLAAGGRTAAVMISASHNPPEYNGIKMLGPDGMKLPDDVEASLEEMILAVLGAPGGAGVSVGAGTPGGGGALGGADAPGGTGLPGGSLAEPLAVGERRVDVAAAGAYLDFLRARLPDGLAGLHIVLDCAHGAAYRLAPELLAGTGARLTVLHAEPDGLNINRGCGATDPALLAQAVRREGADLGFAFDGDADRCVAVDERGQVVDGDAILAVTALDRHRRGRLAGPGVVATVMSNLGLERALARHGIALHRTRVGDRYVLEELRRRGLAVGGEQSGHVIFLDAGQTTGDGLLTMVEVLDVVQRAGRPLSELAAVMERLPQRLRNLRAPDAPRLVEAPGVQAAVDRARERLAGMGRILVRASGTEPVVRVMVEAEDEALIDEVLADVAAALERAAGGNQA